LEDDDPDIGKDRNHQSQKGGIHQHPAEDAGNNSKIQLSLTGLHTIKCNMRMSDIYVTLTGLNGLLYAIS